MPGESSKIQNIREDFCEAGVYGKYEFHLRRREAGSVRVEIDGIRGNADCDTESVVNGHWFPL